MCSIETIQSTDELGHFKTVLDELGHNVSIIASMKENGHGVRAVYYNGELVSGSTRGRYKKGRDITRHLRAVLPNHVDAWETLGLVEVRGEMLVSKHNFEEHLKGKTKTPLSSVTSLIRDSVTDDELQYLEMVCYKVIVENSKLEFSSLKDEFVELENNGFKTPTYIHYNGVNSTNVEAVVKAILNAFERHMDEDGEEYDCDGIVFAINNNDDFYSTGKTGNHWNGNFALKSGRYWEQNIYSSIIRDIEFIPGKSYIVPKAIVEPFVTANGSTVVNVPLYNVGVIERYHYVPGETIFFRFGGEQSVILTDCYGDSIRV